MQATIRLPKNCDVCHAAFDCDAKKKGKYGEDICQCRIRFSAKIVPYEEKKMNAICWRCGRELPMHEQDGETYVYPCICLRDEPLKG